ncbi:hypothetical protein FB451DRAFT_1182396 [Mycena latifolia]|nr:hypothetical protein FB451DRAFT_1182396 [Mycena latifolia]
MYAENGLLHARNRILVFVAMESNEVHEGHKMVLIRVCKGAGTKLLPCLGAYAEFGRPSRARLSRPSADTGVPYILDVKGKWHHLGAINGVETERTKCKRLPSQQANYSKKKCRVKALSETDMWLGSEAELGNIDTATSAQLFALDHSMFRPGLNAVKMKKTSNIFNLDNANDLEEEHFFQLIMRCEARACHVRRRLVPSLGGKQVTFRIIFVYRKKQIGIHPMNLVELLGMNDNIFMAAEHVHRYVRGTIWEDVNSTLIHLQNLIGRDPHL